MKKSNKFQLLSSKINFNINEGHQGGGITISESFDSIIEFCSFRENMSFDSGGAINMLETRNLTMNNTVIE